MDIHEKIKPAFEYFCISFEYDAYLSLNQVICFKDLIQVIWLLHKSYLFSFLAVTLSSRELAEDILESHTWNQAFEFKSHISIFLIK